MRNSKDVMPLWGPYSKKYMGISHVVNPLSKMGARFDFIVHPTLWNSAFPPPNVTFPSGYHLWHCRENYSFYAYRCELMWKDQIYCDVSFSRIGSDSYLVLREFVNHTDLRQNCLINCLLGPGISPRLLLPRIRPFRDIADRCQRLLLLRIRDTPSLGSGKSGWHA